MAQARPGYHHGGEVRTGRRPASPSRRLTGTRGAVEFHTNDAAGALTTPRGDGYRAISRRFFGELCCGTAASSAKIWHDCRESRSCRHPRVLQTIGVNEVLPLYRGKGCPSCRGTGIGRTGVLETSSMMNTGSDREQSPDGDTEEEGNRTWHAGDARRCHPQSLDGITTLEEALIRRNLNNAVSQSPRFSRPRCFPCQRSSFEAPDDPAAMLGQDAEHDYTYREIIRSRKDKKIGKHAVAPIVASVMTKAALTPHFLFKCPRY